MRVNPFDQKDESFIFTAETTPSVSTNLNESVEKISSLIGVADAVNIQMLQTARQN